MIYQVTANLYFKEPDEATDFFTDCKVALQKSDIIQDNTPEQSPTLIALIENHHDERPTAPCIRIDFEPKHY